MYQSKHNEFRELNESFNNICIANLNIILEKYESHNKFDPNNLTYQIFKDLKTELDEFKTIMKYLEARPDIHKIYKEHISDILIDSEDEKYDSSMFLILVDETFFGTDKIYNNKNLPHTKEETNKLKNYFLDNEFSFERYCYNHHVISVDSLVAIKGLNFYNKYPPHDKFNASLLKKDISEEVYQWFTDFPTKVFAQEVLTKEKLDQSDINLVKTWFITKYTALSCYYGNIELVIDY